MRSFPEEGDGNETGLGQIHVILENMALIPSVDISVAVLCGVVFIYGLVKYRHNYWRRKGVFHLKPEFFFGNFRKVARLQVHQAEVIRALYEEMGDVKICGIYEILTPAVIVKNPDLLKLILVKEFQHFMDRGINFDLEHDILAQNLVFLKGSAWRDLRTKLTPTFTSSKMKMMFQLMCECTHLLRENLAHAASKGEIIDVKDVLASFTTDIIGTCAFGLQLNTMTNPNCEFREKGRKIFEPGMYVVIQRLMFIFFPRIAKFLGLKSQRKDVTSFFLNVVKETVDYRKNNKVKRNDFLQMLIDLKMKGVIEEHYRGENTQRGATEIHHQDERDGTLEMTDNLLAAQVFIFFVAGFENSATTMSFALYELARNPEIQERLKTEVDSALQECDGAITYEVIQKMQYLDKVISEVLRKYPPLGFLLRECTIPFDIPETGTHLDKGTRVVIPVYGLHYDPRYYPDPERFDPERFSEENKAQRPHYTYLPFGEGPRVCIGMRFGLLQAKLGLLIVVANYEISVCKDTPVPMVFSPTSINLSSKHGYKLRITKRS